jgi:hypothetical protein
MNKQTKRYIKRKRKRKGKNQKNVHVSRMTEKKRIFFKLRKRGEIERR